MDATVQTLTPLHAVVGTAVQLVFPGLALGLAGYLAVLETLWVASRNPVFRDLYVFWARIFGVCLTLGLVAVIAMGSNLGWTWSLGQIATVGLVLAALAAAMLFGKDRTGAPSHLLASLVMAAAMTAGLVWMSWLAHSAAPGGADMPDVIARQALGAVLITSLAVGAVSAWRLLRRPEEAESAMALRMSVGMLAISATLRLLIDEPAASAPAVSGGEAWPLQIEAGLGAAVIWLALWAGWLVRRRGGVEQSRAFLRACLAMGAVGAAALVSGWAFGRAGVVGTRALETSSIGALLLSGAYALLFGLGGYLILRLATRPLQAPQDTSEPR